jgi:hypothetical protein
VLQNYTAQYERLASRLQDMALLDGSPQRSMMDGVGFIASAEVVRPADGRYRGRSGSRQDTADAAPGPIGALAKLLRTRHIRVSSPMPIPRL